MAAEEPAKEREAHGSTSPDPLLIQRATDGLMDALLAGVIRNGRLIIRDRPIEEIVSDYKGILIEAVRSLHDDETGSSPTFKTVLDHREGILDNARSAFLDGDAGLSVLLYGTWCEHHVNLLLTTAFDRLKYSESTSTTLVRNCNIWTKVTALWEIAGLRSWDDDSLKILKSLTDARNGYAHYKWKYVEDFKFDHVERYEEVLSKIDILIDFMMTVEDDLTWNGRKDEIVTAIRALRRK